MSEAGLDGICQQAGSCPILITTVMIEELSSLGQVCAMTLFLCLTTFTTTSTMPVLFGKLNATPDSQHDEHGCAKTKAGWPL